MVNASPGWNTVWSTRNPVFWTTGMSGWITAWSVPWTWTSKPAALNVSPCRTACTRPGNSVNCPATAGLVHSASAGSAFIAARRASASRWSKCSWVMRIASAPSSVPAPLQAPGSMTRVAPSFWSRTHACVSLVSRIMFLFSPPGPVSPRQAPWVPATGPALPAGYRDPACRARPRPPASSGVPAPAGRPLAAAWHNSPVEHVSPAEHVRAAPGELLRGPLSGTVRRHWLFVLAMAGAVAVRAVTMLAFRPVLWFGGDSASYVATALRLMPDPSRLGGYGLLLWLLRPLHSFAAVAAVQHMAGLAMGVMIYLLARRYRLPAWAATLAAVPVLFDAYQLQLEHDVVPDVLFSFLAMLALTLVLWGAAPGRKIPAVLPGGSRV